MKYRLMFAAAPLAAFLMSSAATQAATITGDFSAWAAAVGPGYANTTSTGLPLYFEPVSSFLLSDGMTLSVAGTGDTVLQPLNGWGPWSGDYAGDVIDTSNQSGYSSQSETISFASSVSALGMDLSPDFGPLSPSDAETFTVTLSDGTTAQFDGSYPPGTTQFVGFYGDGDITSITISVANAPDFAFGNFVDVPEPVSMMVLATGLAGLGMARRRR